MRALALLLTLLAMGLVLGPATGGARAATDTCGLPGLVRPGATSPCPRNRRHPADLARAEVRPRVGPTLPAARANLSLGGIATSIAGDALTLSLTSVVRWVVRDAAAGLRATVPLISTSTRPQLNSTWFSATYWRVASIGFLLTVPFLCGAAVHALIRSELALLGRAAFGYLPLAVLGVYLAGPLTTLMLSATDAMGGLVAAASSHAENVFIARAAAAVSTASVIDADPFIALLVGVITVMATLTLWLELLIRNVAVDVIVLMLPLFFAAMVWPARRMWAVRAVETLFALILAKFAIVCVLALGGAAVGGAGVGPAQMLTGLTLLLLAALSPWALLRLLPIHEVAAAAAGGLSHGPRNAIGDARRSLERFAGRGESPRGGPSADPSDAEPGLDPEAVQLGRLGMVGGSADDARRGAGGNPPALRIGSGDASSDAEPATVASETGGGPLAGDRVDDGDAPSELGDVPMDPHGRPAAQGGTATAVTAPAVPSASQATELGRPPINRELAPDRREDLPVFELGEDMFAGWAAADGGAGEPPLSPEGLAATRPQDRAPSVSPAVDDATSPGPVPPPADGVRSLRAVEPPPPLGPPPSPGRGGPAA